MNYTDEQIKKALECCFYATTQRDLEACEFCPLQGIGCTNLLIELVNDLVNRQEAEIERLKEEVKTTERNVLISFANVLVTVYSYQPITPEKKKVVDVDVIVSLVKALTEKEMVGESK